MNKRVNQNRYKPRSSSKPQNPKKFLILALIILVVLLVIEILKPTFHAASSTTTATTIAMNTVAPVATTTAQTPTTPTPTSTTSNDTPSFDFYQVLPKVSLESANLDNLDSTTQPISVTPKKSIPANPNINYSLQFASFKDVDQASALATKINAVKGLGSHQAQVVISSKGSNTWYVVNIGPFATSQDAQDIQDILDRYYFSGRIFTNQK